MTMRLPVLSVRGPARTTRPWALRGSRLAKWAGRWIFRFASPLGPSKPKITNFIYVGGAGQQAVHERESLLPMLFERAPVLIASRGFMPPPDLIFPELPTKIDHTSIAKMRKVTQPDIHVLDEHAEFVNCLQICADLLQAYYIQVTDRTTAAVLSLGAGSPNLLLCLEEERLGLLDRGKP